MAGIIKEAGRKEKYASVFLHNYTFFLFFFFIFVILSSFVMAFLLADSIRPIDLFYSMLLSVPSILIPIAITNMSIKTRQALSKGLNTKISLDDDGVLFNIKKPSRNGFPDTFKSEEIEYSEVSRFFLRLERDGQLILIPKIMVKNTDKIEKKLVVEQI